MTAFKLDLFIIAVALTGVLYLKYCTEPEPHAVTLDVPNEVQGDIERYELMSWVDPIEDPEFGTMSPSLGLTIIGSIPGCVDTYLLADVSCADKAAVIKYRKAQALIETKRVTEKLRRNIRELEILELKKEFGIMECKWHGSGMAVARLWHGSGTLVALWNA